MEKTLKIIEDVIGWTVLTGFLALTSLSLYLTICAFLAR